MAPPKTARPRTRPSPRKALAATGGRPSPRPLATAAEPLGAGLQRSLVLAAVVAGAVVFWRGATDPFEVVKMTVIGGLALAVLAVAAVRTASTGTLGLHASPAVLALAAFSAALVLATVTSPAPAVSLVGDYARHLGLVSYLAYVVLFLGVVQVFRPVHVRHLVFAVLGSAVVVVAYGLIQVADADPFDWVAYTTVFSTLSNPNFLAGWLAVVLPLAAWAALTSSLAPGLRLAALALAAGAALVVVETGSFQGPTAGVAGVAVVVGAWLWGRRREGRIGPLGVPAVLGGVVVVVVLAVLLGAGRIRAEVAAGLDERVSFWRAAGSMVGEQPLLGVGLDQYGSAFSEYRPVEHATEYGASSAEAAHSVPLQMFADGGLLLGLAYLAVVVTVAAALVRALLRTDGEERLLLAAVGGAWFAYQVQAAVSIDVPPLAVLHWVLSGAVLVLAGRVAGEGPVARPPPKGVPLPAAAGVAFVLTVVGVWFLSRPLRADAALSAALTSIDDGRITEARADLDTAARLAPWESNQWLVRARYLERLGDVPGALAAARRAAATEPGSGPYAYQAARLAALEGEADEARRRFADAVRLDPRDPAFLREVAAGAIADGHPDVAVEALERVVRIVPDDAAAYVALSDARRLAGDVAGADEARARALELDPAAVPAAAA